MIVQRGQSKPQNLRNNTTNGVLITVYLVAAAANTAITPSGLVRTDMTLKVTLNRNEKNVPVCNDNLQILGMYSAKNYGLRDWINGNKMTLAAVGVTEDMICNVFVNFGGAINLKGSDTLTATLQLGSNCFGAAYSQANSYVEFDFNISPNDYETGVPQISAEVFQTNQNEQKFYPGDHVGKCMILNFDKDNITNQIVNTCQFSSDRFDMSMNFFQLWNRDRNVLLPPRMEERFTTTAYDPASITFGYQQAYPQTMCLFSSDGGEKTINNVAVEFSCDGGQVAASQNWLVWTSFIVSKQSIARGLRRQAKHNKENFESLPASVPGDASDAGGPPAGIAITETAVI